MVLVPQIDIEKTRGAIVQTASHMPSRKMFAILMRSSDLMLDDMVEARDSLQDAPESLKVDLANWDAAFAAYGERDAWYANALMEGGELKRDVENPMLLGQYPSEAPSPPNWPDVETPWRLMNELAIIGAKAKRGQEFFDALEGRWKSNFERYWKSNSMLMAMQAKKLEEGGDEGLSFSSTGDEEPGLLESVRLRAQGYQDAADSSASFAQKADSFFSKERWEEFKKSAKKVGIGIAVGALLTLLLVARR